MTGIRFPVRLGSLAVVVGMEAAYSDPVFAPSWLGLLAVAALVVFLLVAITVLLLVVAFGRRPGRDDSGAARVGPPPPRDREPAPRAGPAVSRQEHCPECGAALPPDSPEGLCPPCLLKAGVGSAADLASGSRTPRTTPHPGPGAAASPEELAAHFPQLEVL